MPALSGARGAVGRLNRLESGFNCIVCVEARLVHEVVEALAVELSLPY